MILQESERVSNSGRIKLDKTKEDLYNIYMGNQFCIIMQKLGRKRVWYGVRTGIRETGTTEKSRKM